jgi:hypothetical protein
MTTCPFKQLPKGEILRRFVKYLIQGVVVFSVTYKPEEKKSAFFAAIVSVGMFSIMDTYMPSIRVRTEPLREPHIRSGTP